MPGWLRNLVLGSQVGAIKQFIVNRSPCSCRARERDLIYHEVYSSFMRPSGEDSGFVAVFLFVLFCCVIFLNLRTIYYCIFFFSWRHFTSLPRFALIRVRVYAAFHYILTSSCQSYLSDNGKQLQLFVVPDCARLLEIEGLLDGRNSMTILRAK